MNIAKQNEQRGAILVLTMVMLVLCSGLLTTMYITAHTDSRNSLRKARQAIAMTCTENGVAKALTELTKYAANFTSAPHTGTMTTNGTVVNWSITTAKDSSGDDIVVMTEFNDSFKVFARLTILSASTVYEGIFARSQTYMSLDQMPIFQFLAFYNQDLEIHPLTDTKLRGRVYTNSDLYLSSKTSLKFQTDWDIRTAGSLFRHRKDDPTGYPSGKVAFGSKLIPSYLESGWTGTWNGKETDFASAILETWEGTVKTQEHCIKKIETPQIGTTLPYESNPVGDGDYTYNSLTGKYDYTPGSGTSDKAFFHCEADMVIADGKLFLSGVEIAVPVGAITEKIFYDGRENKFVRTTDIDLGLLGGTNVTVNGVSRPIWPSNGLLYAYRTDSTVANPNGIRFTNCSILKDKLTTVCPNPVYIWGNYNNANKKPSSIICDALNLLSKKWDDTKIPGTLPDAIDTAYELAFIAGGSQTSVGDYNGGYENLPRFHENWNLHHKAHMTGSWVNLWDSQIAKGPWEFGGDNYTEPARDWYFDRDFLDPDKLPPYTPNVYFMRTVAWWRTGRLPYSIFVTK